jgi:hypothetical protein
LAQGPSAEFSSTCQRCKVDGFEGILTSPEIGDANQAFLLIQMNHLQPPKYGCRQFEEHRKPKNKRV